MKLLGIESTCDETAAAVVEDGRRVLSNVVLSQISLHAPYGGVVPEVAARSHLEAITPVINHALREAGLGWPEIDAVAVAFAPGLIGSLLIGTLAARTYALVMQKPLYAVHHVEAHTYAAFLSPVPPQFPFLSLTVSGGHTQLVLFRGHGDYTVIGQTRDDAVGEAFDKVAKVIGLPYPGGPAVAAAALLGHDRRYPLPTARLGQGFDFSFSGLKTAVLRTVQREAGVDISYPSYRLAEHLSPLQQADMAASFERVAVETLVRTTARAADVLRPRSVVLAGGVAANARLRREMETRFGSSLTVAPLPYCTDNAAMIASLGYYQSFHRPAADPLGLDVQPSLSLREEARTATQ